MKKPLQIFDEKQLEAESKEKGVIYALMRQEVKQPAPTQHVMVSKEVQEDIVETGSDRLGRKRFLPGATEARVEFDESAGSKSELGTLYGFFMAWHLYENNREIELVDPKLSDFSEEEIKLVIRVALLCIQTSPTLRPPMSRVVAMLSGDVEVSTVTTKPRYLTDWNFDESTSFVSDVSTKRADNSFYNSSASTTILADTDLTLHEITGGGR
ncbi:hypothetical protein L1049_023185 [Liquidambar formosana]|uniref:Uncharacterized protein n=1 Tax=Liquidambar formosana TaxID=63359 RepID=A0AAP0RFJ5_LIQFO